MPPGTNLYRKRQRANMRAPLRAQTARAKRMKAAADGSDEEPEDSSDSSSVSAVGRNIYFYTEVTPESVLELNKLIVSCGKTSMAELNGSYEKPPPIYLHINSPGGDVFAALSAVDTIRLSPVPVITIVEGLAASAATLISIVGNERWIAENASMLGEYVRPFFPTNTSLPNRFVYVC